MKIGIVYYSRTGNTKKAAQILEEKLKQEKADVDLIQVEHVKKPGFFGAGRAAMKQEELPIANTDFDLKKYDMILVGSPTWAGKASPFIKSFFNKAQNIKGKNACVFYTCGGNTEEAQTGGMLKGYLKEVGVKPKDEILSFRMKKEEILDGEQNIDSFVKTVMKK